ncbi:MAG: hypothetical protein OMM_10395, partial [Candidatus Magnetoglobus multicellularis str. Araruama]
MILIFYHPEGQRIKLKQIGIRSASQQNLRAIIHHVERNTSQQPCIFLNMALYHLIASASDFNGDSLFLSTHMTPYERLSGKKVRLIKVWVVPFDLSGEHPWLVINNHLADQLKMNKNITTIYPENNGTIHNSIYQVQKHYASKGIATVLWSDRLPFFNAMLYTLATR